MNIKPRRNRGAILTSGIGILVGVILLLLALFLIIYLLLALFRVPVRAFPKETEELYSQYIYEPITTAEKWSELEAPEGLQYRSVPLLFSTNLVTWETVMCRVDLAGGIHAPDGSVLQLMGSWDDEAQEWVALQSRVVVAGTNEVMVFRLP